MGTTTFTGPVQAGNIVNSDGSGTLASAGSTTNGTQNVGYCTMTQSCAVTQVTNVGVAGKFVTPIVVPFNSQILSITLSSVNIWDGVSPNFTVTAVDAAGDVLAFSSGTFSGGTVGLNAVTPGTDGNVLLNWTNTGYNQAPNGGTDSIGNFTSGQGFWGSDVQFIVNSTNTGGGTGYLTVTYVQSNSLNVSIYE